MTPSGIFGGIDTAKTSFWASVQEASFNPLSQVPFGQQKHLHCSPVALTAGAPRYSPLLQFGGEKTEFKEKAASKHSMLNLLFGISVCVNKYVA